jgi:hypothetical protein
MPAANSKTDARAPKRARRRQEKPGGPAVDPQPEPLSPGWLLALAAAATLLFLFAHRLGARQPWSYDEYYHLGVARELAAHFPLRSFPWTPFSILSTHYADKELLFHLLLAQFARLPLETASLIGVLLGQLFFLSCFAWALHRLKVPRAPWYLLGLITLGSMFVYRLSMCRPHLWMTGFCVLVLTLLVSNARWWSLALVSALFGLSHTSGWIAVPFAGVWVLAGWITRQGPTWRQWRQWSLPFAATAGGWLAGQLIHPNFPHNFQLLILQNLVVPFQSAGAGGTASRQLWVMMGAELTPAAMPVLLLQWTAFLAPLLVAFQLLREPRLRTRGALTTAAIGLGFLLLGTFLYRRFFEVGAPLSLLALAFLAAERRRLALPRRLPGWGGMFGVFALLLGGLWTWTTVSSQGFGVSEPLEMARWMGANGRPGERVFTAQWADSAPLFYFAPHLRSLVALDPTFFWIQDPERFNRYSDTAFGKDADPVSTIQRDFGARYVTVWKTPDFERLANQLARDGRARIVYNDSYYLVWELLPG